jgi:hypothetical protein
MQRLTKHRTLCRAHHDEPQPKRAKGPRFLLVAATLITIATVLSACGGSAASSGSQPSGALSGNWQFTMAPQTDGNPNDPTFNGGLQGGFLLQNNGSASGQTVYSVTSSASASGLPCNSGSAPVAVTISGQTVTLTEVAGTQTFTLTGTLSSNGSTMAGTYTSTAGTGPDGSPCGYVETGLSWSAIFVPPLSGSITGNFHSTSGNSGLDDQDFAVTGVFTQGENIGASNATVTGTLLFTGYPCLSVASVNGQISGTSVLLQMIGTNGSQVGQIGEPPALLSTTGVEPVIFSSVQGGYILHGLQPTYMVLTSTCTGPGLNNTTSAGDSGNICLALNNSTACQQPIALSPAAVTFPAQMLGSSPSTQSITLTNISSSALNGLTLSFTYNGDNLFGSNTTDFDGVPSFTETDACGPGGSSSHGNPFDLGPGQSCSITTTFSPQESCPWLPFPSPPSISGAPPEWCPLPQSATVQVNSPASADPEKSFAVPITGIGLSAIQPSTPELDFGAEEQFNPPEASLPQTLSFTNYGANPVQILGRALCLNQTSRSHNTLPSPRSSSSPIAGLQVLSNDVYQITPDPGTTPATIFYRCDSDAGTSLPNFQISSDTCTGSTLYQPGSSQGSNTCSIQIAYAPQPNTDVNSGLDYFLELNTIQCWPVDNPPADCEFDSGRFPVELKANTPSPLRMSPGAGLDFGQQNKGTTSAPLTITLLNDPTLQSPQTISFTSKILVQGNYAETDDCPVTLAPGSSCNINVTFAPSGVGFEAGSLTINYSPAPFGVAQYIYLRGTGQ